MGEVREVRERSYFFSLPSSFFVLPSSLPPHPAGSRYRVSPLTPHPSPHPTEEIAVSFSTRDCYIKRIFVKKD